LRNGDRQSPPFSENLARAHRTSHWVRPELVAEVAFTEWTSNGGIRHPSFKGLREDKSPADVVAETPMNPAVGDAATRL